MIRVDVGIGLKFLVLRIRTRSVSSRSFVRGCRPVPKNWVVSGGAGGIRVPAIVTAVCVVAAVDDSVNGYRHCCRCRCRTGLRQMMMSTVLIVLHCSYSLRIRWRFQ